MTWGEVGAFAAAAGGLIAVVLGTVVVLGWREVPLKLPKTYGEVMQEAEAKMAGHALAMEIAKQVEDVREMEEGNGEFRARANQTIGWALETSARDRKKWEKKWEKVGA